MGERLPSVGPENSITSLKTCQLSHRVGEQLSSVGPKNSITSLKTFVNCHIVRIRITIMCRFIVFFCLLLLIPRKADVIINGW